MKAKWEFDALAGIISKFKLAQDEAVEIAKDALLEAQENINWDIEDALQPPNLPRKGKFSKDPKTVDKILESPIEVSGTVLSVEIGFRSQIASAFLTSGVQNRGYQPDKKLAKIFKSKTYKNEQLSAVEDNILEAITKRLI